MPVSAATGSENASWWDANRNDSINWTSRIPVTLTESLNTLRTNEPVTFRMYELFGYGYNYSGINPDSFRVIDPSATPDETGEINGNDVPSQIEHTGGTTLIGSNDLLVFSSTVPANTNKTYYVYYSRNSAIIKKSYTPIIWNLMSNPGFEAGTGSTTASWMSVGSGYSRVSGTPHTGTYSVQMNASDALQSYGLRQKININPSKKWDSLTISGWVKADSVTGVRDKGNSIYTDTYYDPSGSLYAEIAYFSPGTYDWQLFEITIKPTSPVKEIDPYIFFKNHSGNVWVDDVSIYSSAYSITSGASEDLGIPSSAPQNTTAIHPRLYFSAADLPALKEKMQQSPTSITWNEIKNTALTFNSFPSGINDVQSQWNSWTGLRYTAFYYSLTGDVTVGNKGKTWLLYVCSWPSWTPPTGGDNRVNYDTGKIAIAVGEAYDMLYPLLSDAERATVRQAILEKAVKPAYLDYNDGSYLVDAKTNRAAQGYGGIGVAGLAIKGDGSNDGDLTQYMTASNFVIKEYLNTYDADGGLPEGISYESYGLTDGSGALYYLEANRRITGENLYATPGFSHVMNYPLYMLPPDRKSATDSFGDASFTQGYSAGAMTILSTAFNDGRGKWYLSNSPVYTFDNVPTFIWSNASIPVISPDTLPTSKLFEGVGVAVMRTGWGLNDMMMTFRSSPVFPGHNRPEQNSFTLDAFGERLIIEPGMPGAQGYSDPNYLPYYASTVSQNTLLINGDPHSQSETNIDGDKISRPAGAVTEYFDENFYSEVTGNAKDAYNGKLSKFDRQIVVIKPDYTVILDDMASATVPVEFDSLLHTLGTDSIKVSGDNVTITQNNVKLYTRAFIPSFAYTINSGQPYNLKTGAIPTSYIKMYSAVPSTQASYLYVLSPVQGNGAVPQVSKVQNGSITGAIIEQNGFTDLVLFNTAGSGIESNGISTDGNKAYIRIQNGIITRFALQNGKILSYNGTDIFNSAQVTSVAREANIVIKTVNRPPVLSSINDRSIDEISLLTFVVMAMDPDGNPLTYSATGLPANSTFTPSSRIFSWIPANNQAGIYNVTFTVSDGMLQDSKSVKITVNDLNTGPVLSLIADKTVDEGNLMSFLVMATDPEGNLLTYSASGLPANASFIPASRTFSWTSAYNQAGTYNVTFTVSDGSLQDSKSVKITVKDINTAPVIASIADKTVDEGKLLTFAVTATDPEGNPLTYSASGLPANATFDPVTHTFAWTPAYDQSGTYNVSFIVSDGVLLSSIPVKIVVNDVNIAWVFSLITDKTIDEGKLLTFTVPASDPDNNLITYSASDLPANATFDPVTHTFAWTPSYDQAGIYNVTFTVSDGTLLERIPIKITVNDINRPPVLSSIADKTTDEGKLLSFVVMASDPDGNNLTYSASGLPANATFAPASRTFSWIPANNQAGTYNVTFTVSDGILQDSKSIKITVKDINTAPVMASIADKTTDEGKLLSFVVMATDAEGNLLTYSASGLPANATFTPASKTFSWTPANNQAGTYNVTFTVSDGILQDSKSVKITVKDINTAPVMASIADKTTDEGNLLSFVVTATDAEGNLLTYSASGLPANATFAPASRIFSWTPANYQAGTYNVTFIVSDGMLQDSKSVKIIVNNVNNAPVLGPVADTSVNQNEVLNIQVTASDPDGDVLTYSASNLPKGATFSPATRMFTWSPAYNQVGNYTVTFGVSDGTLSASRNVAIAAVKMNYAPYFTLGNATTLTYSEGSSIRVNINAADWNHDVITYSATNLPKGATINSAGHSFSWTPGYDQAGTYDITLIVSDGTLQSSKLLHLIINDKPTPVSKKTGTVYIKLQ